MSTSTLILSLPIRGVAAMVRFVYFMFDFIWVFARALMNPANMIAVMCIAVAVYYFFFMEAPPEFRL